MTTDHKPQTGTLAEFLLARIAEDEAVARAAIQTPGATHWHWVDHDTDEPVKPNPVEEEFVGGYERRVDLRTVEKLEPVSWEGGKPLPNFILPYTEEVPSAAGLHIARHDPARVLAECEAKRRIVEIHGNGDAWCDYCAGYAEGLQDECHTGRLLALPHADHPDYREEWKP